ncbi:hypothetical protein F4778DRAFT_478176 [Xylariomycetidae sp. FL2044]|nr:hypothetical protein F4778DRAFT_478176 [Xylariomycetidae sp. FL2044]
MRYDAMPSLFRLAVVTSCMLCVCVSLSSTTITVDVASGMVTMVYDYLQVPYLPCMFVNVGRRMGCMVTVSETPPTLFFFLPAPRIHLLFLATYLPTYLPYYRDLILIRHMPANPPSFPGDKRDRRHPTGAGGITLDVGSPLRCRQGRSGE